MRVLGVELPAAAHNLCWGFLYKQSVRGGAGPFLLLMGYTSRVKQFVAVRRSWSLGRPGWAGGPVASPHITHGLMS